MLFHHAQVHCGVTHKLFGNKVVQWDSRLLNNRRIFPSFEKSNSSATFLSKT